MIDLNDIRSLPDFKRNTGELMQRIRESGKPMVLTVNGQARLVIQDAAAYQRLLTERDQAEALQGIREGLDDVKHGRALPVRQALKKIRRRNPLTPID